MFDSLQLLQHTREKKEKRALGIKSCFYSNYLNYGWLVVKGGDSKVWRRRAGSMRADSAVGMGLGGVAMAVDRGRSSYRREESEGTLGMEA